MSLLDGIARAINLPPNQGLFTEVAKSAPPSVLHRGGSAPLANAVPTPAPAVAKPILQFSPFPITLDPASYQNPLSDSNPGGDIRTLHSFRQLVDPVPSFGRSYNASTSSTEDIYGQIIHGANVQHRSTFTAAVISSAQKTFQSQSFANMDGTPGTWRPVYAVPEDWYTDNNQRFIPMNLDSLDTGATSSPFSVIGADAPPLWRLGDSTSKAVSPLDPKSSIQSFQMEYLFVQLRRPWLSPTVFHTGDWNLSGQNSGFCSTGSLDVNPGILPLIPTGMLIARNVTISATWSAQDTALLAEAQTRGQPAFLGPFPANNQATTSSPIMVIAWVSDLVPFSPPC